MKKLAANLFWARLAVAGAGAYCVTLAVHRGAKLSFRLHSGSRPRLPMPSFRFYFPMDRGRRLPGADDRRADVAPCESSTTTARDFVKNEQVDRLRPSYSRRDFPSGPGTAASDRFLAAHSATCREPCWILIGWCLAALDRQDLWCFSPRCASTGEKIQCFEQMAKVRN